MPKENERSELETITMIQNARDLLDEVLRGMKGKAAKPKPSAVAKPKLNPTNIDFSIPTRAFIKKYSGGMNGAKKFTLLVAFLSKGNPNNKIRLADVESCWNKATALLGTKFNRLYTSEAKDNDWVNTEKTGSYYLRPDWKQIFQ